MIQGESFTTRAGVSLAEVGLAVAALVGCSPDQETPQPHTSDTGVVYLYEVEKVVDGDTVKLDTDGDPQTKPESVRLIGIDTPETVDPRKPVQCFGEKASEHAKEVLDGELVGLELDESQGTRDRYGRLLGYIILPNGDNFNLTMIEDGLANSYNYEPSNPHKYLEEFEAAEDRAREAELGLWSPKTCSGKR